MASLGILTRCGLTSAPADGSESPLQISYSQDNMKTLSLALSFTDDRQLGPIAELYLKSESKHEPLLIANCMKFEEFEYYIDRLKEELEAIKTDARAKFAAAKRRR